MPQQVTVLSAIQELDIVSQQAIVTKFIPMLSHDAAKNALPTLPEILVVFAEKQLPQPVIAHSIAVAYVAVSIAECLTASHSVKFDIPALAAGGLLHDVEKIQTDHAKRGAAFVTQLGYSSLAPMIATHMELDFFHGQPLGEAAILYLADKICKGSKLISLEKRLAQCIQTYGNLPSIRKKFNTAFIIRDSVVQAAAGKSILIAEKIIWKAITGGNNIYGSESL
jgi:putative nucleotidyltransferase with HDIG domain